MVNYFFNKTKDRKPLKINLISFFDEKAIEYKETSTGELILSCPKCGRNKLYVHEETGVGQCKYASCEFVSGVSPVKLIAALLDISTSESYNICFGNEKYSKEDFLEFEPSNKKIKKEDNALVEISMIPLAVKLTEAVNKEAWDYLINRGMTPEEIDRTEMMVMSETDRTTAYQKLIGLRLQQEDIKAYLKYIKRVIFPVKIDDKLYGYVARDYTGLVPKEYKALNSKGQFRRNVFWNYNNIKDSETIVICEGFMDAIKCGVDRSIALLGTELGDGQAKIIKGLKKAKRIILALDVGTEKTKNKIFEMLMATFLTEIYEVQFKELLEFKHGNLNESIIKAIEEVNGDKITEWTCNSIVLSHSIYIKIKKMLKTGWFSSGQNPLSREDFDKMNDFIKNAQYKDAGDYNKDEMDEMIKNAKKFKKYEVDSDVDEKDD